MSDITIRPFRSSDKATALALLGGLQDHERSLHSIVLPWSDVKDAYWQWLSSNIEKKSGFIFLAEANKAVVGIVTGWVDEFEFPRIRPDEWRYGYVCDIAVAPAARQKGIGKLLMKAAEKFFLQRNVKAMKLMAFANNDLADDFYAGYGMQRFETVHKKYLEAA